MLFTRTQVITATMFTGVLLVAAAIWAQSRLGASLLPHSFCITASAPLLWLHVVRNVLIALAYLLIPLALINLVRRRRDVPFGWVAWLFGHSSSPAVIRTSWTRGRCGTRCTPAC